AEKICASEWAHRVMASETFHRHWMVLDPTSNRVGTDSPLAICERGDSGALCHNVRQHSRNAPGMKRQAIRRARVQPAIPSKLAKLLSFTGGNTELFLSHQGVRKNKMAKNK